MSTNNNNNDCYFRVDSILEEDVNSGNVHTNDVTAQSIESTNSFSVESDASFNSDIQVKGITYAAGLNITSTRMGGEMLGAINLHGNRLSNVARPSHGTSPVPANYIRTPEYFFCSLAAGGRVEISSGMIPVDILGENRVIYQSQDVSSCLRFVGYNGSAPQKVQKGGNAVQFLAKGTYIIDCALTKRWGWNNGWGGTISLADGSSPVNTYSSNDMYSGGGYAARAGLGTVVSFTTDTPNPDGDLTPEGRKRIFRIMHGGHKATMSGFYFSVIFYPERG
ncbi:hypothetical protein [Chlamydia vaughanii]|uniref:hypothetical protein n=1 Tax=Chlamydia vaughanii TaxID=3112552 RepID=UPI0032B13AF2